MNGFHLGDPDFGQSPLKSVQGWEVSFDRLLRVLPEEKKRNVIISLFSIKNLFLSWHLLAALWRLGKMVGNPYVLVTESGREGFTIGVELIYTMRTK